MKLYSQVQVPDLLPPDNIPLAFEYFKRKSIEKRAEAVCGVTHCTPQQKRVNF